MSELTLSEMIQGAVEAWNPETTMGSLHIFLKKAKALADVEAKGYWQSDIGSLKGTLMIGHKEFNKLKEQ